MPAIRTARGVKSSKGDAKKRTAAEKIQDHIDAVIDKTNEVLPSVIEESIHNSVEDYANRDDPKPKQTDLIEKFRSLIPQPTFDDLWTEQDEENLEQEAESDAEFQHRCTYQDYVTSVYKTAYKFMGCLATDIVGPKTYLRFHSDHATSRNRFWAAPFCQKLSAMIVQPVFKGDPGKLALAIQWTVICRTKDRRRWRLSGCGSDDPFLSILKAVVERSQDGTKSPRMLRRMALGIYKERHPTQGLQDPLWSQFLQRIEEQAPRKKPPVEQEEDSQDFGDFPLYRVNATDLNNLMEAIVNVRMSGFPVFPDPTALAMTALYKRNPNDLPFRPQVIEATRAVLLSHRREARRAQKLSMLGDRRPVGPSKSAGAQRAADAEKDSSLASQADSSLSDGEIAKAEARISEEEAEEAEEAEEEAEAAEEKQTPRRSTRQRAKKKVSTPVVLTSDDEDSEEFRFTPTPSSPTKPRPSRAQKEPTGKKVEFFINIPVRSVSSSQARDEPATPVEGAATTGDAGMDDSLMQDDDGLQDFGDVELGESEHSLMSQSDKNNGESPMKRPSETQPEELDPRATKRRRFDNERLSSMQPRGSSRVVVEDSDPGKDLQQEQEQQQEQESRRFLTSAPYREARVGHPVHISFPVVPTDLGLEDALEQVFREAPAAGGSQQPQPDVAAPDAAAHDAEPTAEAQQVAPDQTQDKSKPPEGSNTTTTTVAVKPQYHKKVKRSMLNQADWLWEDGSNPSRRNPMEAWQLLTK